MNGAATLGKVAQGQRSRNSLGIAGFATSLLSILTCGMIAPVGLLLSLLALYKRPRGFATAGAIIGLLGTLWLGLLAAGIGTTVIRLQPAIQHFSGELQQLQVTLQAVTQASQDVVRHRETHGDWPDSDAGQEMVGQYRDVYGTPLKYTRVGEMALVISAGADREFATADDLSLDPTTINHNQPHGLPRVGLGDDNQP